MFSAAGPPRRGKLEPPRTAPQAVYYRPSVLPHAAPYRPVPHTAPYRPTGRTARRPPRTALYRQLLSNAQKRRQGKF